ncbi:hypothetical protein SteCoe_22742 [Stentor coeruleus]|uniref:DRBM domain-containing protein n=1 Tax=Stentor coeruleus TaxID=5963 RepID=A0A1R2BLF7_9CILI|nr:hypothetical protein SteCoe_22742 [Stentor coeruleus]
MSEEKLDKNPISVLNEFCSRTNNKVDYFFCQERGEFCCKVLFLNEVIGYGQDKKKQRAKFKAAEAATKHLSTNLLNYSFESELNDHINKSNSKGYFKLISRSPLFVYEYYIGNLLISSGRGDIESQAKENCAHQALKVISALPKAQFLPSEKKLDNIYENDKLKKSEDFEIAKKSSEKPENLQKIGKLEKLEVIEKLEKPEKTKKKRKSKRPESFTEKLDLAKPTKHQKIEINKVSENSINPKNQQSTSTREIQQKPEIIQTLETPEKLQKSQKSLINSKILDKSCQASNIPTKDPRVSLPTTSQDQRLEIFIDSLLQSFSLNQQELIIIKAIDQEIQSLSQALNHPILSVGSHNLDILRSKKQELDYALIYPGVTEEIVHSIYGISEKARLNFLESKDNQVKKEGLKLSSNIQLCENFLNPYTTLPYIKMNHTFISARLYIFDSVNHPSLIHYKWYKSSIKSSVKNKTSTILRYWRQKFSLEIPVELLDLLIYNFITDDMPCGLAFRILLEHISAGIFLPGAKILIQDSCHEDIYSAWPARFNHEAMNIAMRTLVSISEGDFSRLI